MPLTAGLFWESRGPPDGAPLILSPGLGGSAHYWEPNLDALARRHRLILYDHRGTGRSEALGDAPVTVAAWGEDLIRLMDGIGLDRAAILGHAAGGLAGLACALRHPERVARLVVVNGWARPDPHTARCFDTRLALLRGSGVGAYLHAQPLFLFPAAYISAQAAALAEAEQAQAAAFPPVRTVERRIAALRAFDIHASLERIATPTLVVSAADDMLVPAFRSAELAAGLADATHVALAWGGHAVNVTDPAAFHTAIVAFLDREP